MTTTQLPRPGAPGPGEAAAPVCDVCTHSLEAHDPVAIRFCAATSAHALTRTCLCRQVA